MQKDFKFAEMKSFMLKCMDRLNYHEFKTVNDKKRCFPVKTHDDLIRRVPQHRSITNGQLLQHFAGMSNFAYNNDQKNVLQLICIDLDPYDSNLNNELIFKMCMKRIADFLGVKIFWERSTNYKNIHGYVFFKKERTDTANFNDLLQKLEQVLTNLCPELKAVELLGRPNIYKIENGIIAEIKSQTPVKIPRDYHRIEELKQIGIVEMDQLWNMTDKIEIKKDDNGSGELNIDCIYENNLIPYMRELALSVWQDDVILKDRKVIFEDLFACCLVTYVQNVNKKKTSVRNGKVVWKKLKSANVITKAFNTSVWKVCRDILSANGLLDWSENEYTPPESYDNQGEIQKGKCCIYSFTQEVLDQVNSVGGGSEHDVSQLVSILKKTGQNKVPEMKKGLFFITKIKDDLPIWGKNVA